MLTTDRPIVAKTEKVQRDLQDTLENVQAAWSGWNEQQRVEYTLRALTSLALGMESLVRVVETQERQISFLRGRVNYAEMSQS